MRHFPAELQFRRDHGLGMRRCCHRTPSRNTRPGAERPYQDCVGLKDPAPRRRVCWGLLSANPQGSSRKRMLRYHTLAFSGLTLACCRAMCPRLVWAKSGIFAKWLSLTAVRNSSPKKSTSRISTPLSQCRRRPPFPDQHAIGVQVRSLHKFRE